MNSNERAILELLLENPLLSQNELASILKITRSSVSVYISHLIQEGYIRGRGYLLNSNSSYYVIGSAIIDYRTNLSSETIFDDSTMHLDDCELVTSYGGFAKNIAENLSRLGNTTAAIFAIGDDNIGRELLDECKNNGVNVDDILTVPASKTSTYLEIRSIDRSRIILAATNSGLQYQMTPRFLITKQQKLKNAKAIVLEDGLSVESMQYLTSIYKGILVGVKMGRVKKYKSFLGQFSGLLVSLQIACALTDIPYDLAESDDFVFKVVKKLRSQMKGPLLICYGENKFCFHNSYRVIFCTFSSTSVNAKLYSHYRDPVAAGFVNCIAENIFDEKLLQFVSACREISASLPVPSCQTLCPELVSSTMKELKFHFSSLLLPDPTSPEEPLP